MDTETPAAVDPAAAPGLRHTRAAHIAQVIARLARTRAAETAYADAAPVLLRIAGHMDAAAATLVNAELDEMDGVKVTNRLPAETWQEVHDAETAAEQSPASTGFRPGFAEIVTEVFFA